jgi:hypothetical protein
MFVWRLPDGRVNRNDEKHITGGIKSISKNIERDANGRYLICNTKQRSTTQMVAVFDANLLFSLSECIVMRHNIFLIDRCLRVIVSWATTQTGI